MLPTVTTMLSLLYIFCLAIESSAFSDSLVKQDGPKLSSRNMYSPSELPDSIPPALAFERSTWATGPVSEDSFYQIAPEWTEAEPGTVLKVEEMDPSIYTIPSGTAITRFLYQSKNFLGAKTPASGYILFPFSPRKLQDGSVPVVLWAHGTSGFYPDSAPSHLRDIWQNPMVPTPLVQHGYVVVAPDWAGLGVGKNGAGEDIVHEYLASSAHANDMEFALQAAYAACPFLGRNFTVIGHSQGGGAVWSFAERMHEKPIEGYLGAVAMSPFTRILDEPAENNPILPLLGIAVLPTIASIFSDFDVADVLTPEGIQRYHLDRKTQGNVAVSKALLSDLIDFPMLKEDWTRNEYMQRFQEATANGGKPIKGPMLVIQGDKDPLMYAHVTTSAVEQTVAVSPGESISYMKYTNISHVPAIWVSQQHWLDWIAKRFDGEATSPGFQQEQVNPFLPWARYQGEMNFYTRRATEFYHVP